MIKVTVSELAAFSVCERKSGFVRKKTIKEEQPKDYEDKRKVGTFVHSVMERKVKK